MKKYLIAIMAYLISFPSNGQTWTQMQWGMDKTATPYNFGANVGGTWSSLGTVTSGGIWSIPSSNLYFTQSGVGAATLSIQSDLRSRPWHVKEFGAKCDGATDDTSAIKAAVSALEAQGGGELRFGGSGLCQYNSTTGGSINISADNIVTLTAYGNGGGIKNNSTNGSRLFNIGSAGVHQGQVTINGLILSGSSGSGTAIYGLNAYRLRVTNNQIFGFTAGIGVHGQATYGIQILGNTISANGAAGVYLSEAGGNSAKICNNTITSHQQVNAAAVSIGGTLYTYNPVICNNNIEQNTYGILYSGIRGISIYGNYMEDNLAGQVEISSGVDSAGISINSNTIFGYGSLTNASGISVKDNTWLNSLSIGPVSNIADFNGSINVTISGNYIGSSGHFANIIDSSTQLNTYDSALPTILYLGKEAWRTGTIVMSNGNALGKSITIQNKSATSNYNFNLPSTAGTSGSLLTSQGGSSSDMTWTNTGTSGHVIPYLDGTNVWSNKQTFSSGYLISENLPSASSCGSSPTVYPGSNSQAGGFAFGTGSPASCTINFATSFPNHAYCVATPASSYGGTFYVSNSLSALTVTLGTPTSSVNFNYFCSGN